MRNIKKALEDIEMGEKIVPFLAGLIVGIILGIMLIFASDESIFLNKSKSSCYANEILWVQYKSVPYVLIKLDLDKEKEKAEKLLKDK